MGRNWRWDPCISHSGPEVETFIGEYFSTASKNAILVAGAGFDPRSCVIATRLSAAGTKLRGIFFQEIRPNPSVELVRRAAENLELLVKLVPDSVVVPVEIFETDGAVVGGRNVVKELSRQSLEGVTDIIVDISALSVGTSFPAIRYLVELIDSGKTTANLHLFVTHNPDLDSRITSVASDSPGYVHGFRGELTLDASAKAAKLWLPQLAMGRQQALSRVRGFVDPQDTCPILPFSGRDPRLGDVLAQEYLVEFESGWQVDARDIVYADEEDPLDLYRTILRLDDLRRPVFAEVGGSVLILSPLGSKVMAVGALMAALERDLPVAYLESISYDLIAVEDSSTDLHLIHIWLEGDGYPKPRPRLQS